MANGFKHDGDYSAKSVIIASSITSILDRLEARGCSPRRSGSRWMACCPAHEDRQPSLSVTEGRDGRVLLRCWGGCATEAVLIALDLRWSDLFRRCP